MGTVGPHNIVIAKDEASTSTNPIFRGDLVSGPDTVEYKVPAIDEAGSYFFHCEVHPIDDRHARRHRAASHLAFPAGSRPGATMGA